MRIALEGLLARLHANDTTLRSIDFTQLDIRLDDRMITSLGSAAKRNTVISSLTFEIDCLTAEGCKRLADLLSNLKNLSSLSIMCPSHSRVECWKNIFERLHTTSITKLYLDTTGLDRSFEQHERDAVASFFATNKSITSIEMVCYEGDASDPDFDDEGSASADYGVTLTDCILEGLSSNTTVKSLCLADYMYNSRGRSGLQQFLGLNEGVTTLECISDISDMATALIDGLQYNCRPREIRITNMSEQASATFFSGFGTANNVTTLEVTNCCVTGQALRPFVNGIRKNMDLRCLAMGLGEDTTLSEFLMQCLAPALTNHPSLKEISIQDVDNVFDHVGATALGDALVQNCSVEKVTLQSSEITDNAAMFLGLRIPSIHFIKSLTLVGHLEEAGKQLMADKIRDNYSLTEVAFDPSDTASAAEQQIQRCIKRNQQIERSKRVVPVNSTFFTPYRCKKSTVVSPPRTRETLNVGFQ